MENATLEILAGPYGDVSQGSYVVWEVAAKHVRFDKGDYYGHSLHLFPGQLPRVYVRQVNAYLNRGTLHFRNL